MTSGNIENPAGAPTANLNVASDEVSIYEGGKLIAVAIAELIGNELAIRQLINDYNATKHDNHELQRRVERLTVERAGFMLQPSLLIGNGVFSLVGALLIGLGTNYVTSAQPPPGAWLIVVLGGVTSLVAALLPIALPLLISKYSKAGKDAS